MKNKDHQKIYCFPDNNSTNQYINSTKRVWEQADFEVVCTNLKISDLFAGIKTKKEFLVLNWFEDSVGYGKVPIYTLTKQLIRLALVRLQFSKIIWVKHNTKPHNRRGMMLYKVLTWFMQKVCACQVVHRPIIGESKYIPHPLYSAPNNQLDTNRPINFLIFGVIKKYKGILELLKAWPENVNLKIVGKCTDKGLEDDILNVINKRNLQVEFDNYFVPQSELNKLLTDTKYVILPHHENSMIVSGAFYHAASFGCNVLCLDNEFGQYLTNEFDFVSLFDLESLPMCLSNLNYVEPQSVLETGQQKLSDNLICEQWRKLLMQNPGNED